VLHEAFGDRLKPVEALSKAVAAGRLGRKSGSGFFRYEKGRKVGVDESIYPQLGVRPLQDVDVGEVQRRLVYRLLNEAAMAYAEGVVRSPRDGDIGAIFGFGFAPFRGGPLRTIDDLGAERVAEALEALVDRYGSRFAPAPALVQMASAGGRYYPSQGGP
jgi:3-hydroxyacyl-CoA dehydrogenase/enoyl-CoA hydratase/3-hydroxybutyryl-CoA epimerase